MVLDKGNFGLVVKMRDVRICMATRSDAKRAFLDPLEDLEGGFASIRHPDGRRVVDGWLDVRPVNLQQGLLLTTPSSASKGV